MIRRFALAALMAVVCTALVADVAGAFTRIEAICVKGARLRARKTVLDCRSAAQTTLSNDLQACFGDSSGCVTQCIAKQASDAQVFKDKITACQKDQCTVGTDPTECACKANNATASNACGDLIDGTPAGSAAAVACVAKAQLALFVCNQSCAAQSESGLIDVNGQYNDCLQGCSNP